jgi:tetraacyldisaccharide 4'-kinase
MRKPLWETIVWHVLFPVRLVVALIYSLLITLRNFLYDKGLLPIRRLPRPVISVGNLSLGGTGKTPFTLYLIEQLRAQGYKVGYLSRGYKRQTQGPQEVQLAVSYPAALYGDEATQIKLRYPDLPTFVGENRYEAGQQLIEKYPDTQIIVLDDAFQHRRLHRDIDIVLIDLAKPAWKDWLFPLGTLREPLQSYRRAHLLILNQKHTDQKKVRPPMRRRPMARFVYELQDIWQPEQPPQPVAFLRHKPVFAFAGIAAPESFHLAIQSIPAYIVDFWAFPDHYVYAERDLAKIRKAFRRLERKLGMKDIILLTTEKDFARLYRSPYSHHLAELPLYVLRIRMCPLTTEEETKLQKLITFVPAYGNA